jgi:hypothetical protein
VHQLRVLFVHGLEGSPQGTKARFLAEAFEARTPAMDTSDPEACLALQAEEVRSFAPDVVVGSSFGGGILLHLVQQGVWRGPCVFLAQAAGRRPEVLQAGLPAGVAAVVVHGLRDEVIDPEDSRRLAATGSPELVRHVEVDDDHRLKTLVTTGRLAELVREARALAGADRG